MAGLVECPLAADRNRVRRWRWPVLGLLCVALVAPLAAQPPAAQTYRMVHADAAEIAPQLRSLLGEAGVSAEILVDRAANQLVVQAPAAAQPLTAQLVRTLDKVPQSTVIPAAAEQPATVRGYVVDKSDLQRAVDQVRREFGATAGLRVAADPRASQVIVIAPAAVQAKVAAFLESQQLGLPGGELRRMPNVDGDGAAETVYRLRHISARQFETSLRQLWGSGLALSRQAADGSSLVHVAGDPAATPVLRIDHRNHLVQVLAPGAKGRSWEKVVAALDRPVDPQGAATQLVPLQRADPEKIRQALTMIREAALRAGPGESTAAVPLGRRAARRGPAALVSMIFQETPAAGQQPPQTKPPAKLPAQPGPDAEQPDAAAPGEEALADGGMIGDVQIEYVPELGIIVLRGSRRDVERVRKIIDEIEKRSLETQPEVNVVSLAHTNSEAMTELITEVYTNVYEPRLGPLSITALVKPNAILLVGLQENIDTVVDLVAKLDRPVAPGTQLKVFQLINMSAVDAETYIRNFYGTPTQAAAPGQQAQQQVRGLSTRVAVVADYRSNSLIVQASPRDLAEVEELLRQLDVEKTEASIQLRVFPLKNTMATDLQAVLQNALGLQARTGAAGQQFQPGAAAAAAQAQAQGAVSKSVQIVGIDQKGNKIIESGLLTEVTVAADANSNALVVKAPKHSMGLIEALIEQLDKIPAAESQIKVFQIRNGDATSLTQMLQLLFGQQVTAGQVGLFSQTYGRTFGGQTQLQQAAAGESSLIPLNFATDARTNSIIASGSRADLMVVEAILLKLDEGDLRQRRLIVYRLNNAPAQFVADALTQILTDQQQIYTFTQSAEFPLISQFEYLDQQVFVVPELVSNTLIVSATPEYYEQITEVIQDLDRRPPMIMIQVVVALVRLNEAEEFGVELGIQDSLLFDRGAAADGLLDPGFNFVNQPLGNSASPESLATRELLAGQAFSAFNVGRSSGSEGYPGLVLSAANESINILIRALASKSRVQILSRPQIMTLNNIPASVLVGQRVPQITDFNITNQGTVNSVELQETGISLGVIPRVTPDGLIIMDIEARDSQVGDPAEGIPIGVQDGVVINSPIFDDITAVTTIAARSGQTVVFGGLIVSDRTETFRGVPYLSQIPVVGHLFRFDTESKERSELVFFLTPHIVMGDEDIQMINQLEAERMSWCLADVIEVHGDPGFGPGRLDPWHGATPVIFPHEDPTGQHMILPSQTEVIPTPAAGAASGAPAGVPPNQIPGRPELAPADAAAGPTQAPQQSYLVPRDQQPPSKPFLVPKDQQPPSKPFLVPKDQQPPSKPFFEQPPNRQSSIQPGRFYQFPPPGQSPPVARLPAGSEATGPGPATGTYWPPGAAAQPGAPPPVPTDAGYAHGMPPATGPAAPSSQPAYAAPAAAAGWPPLAPYQYQPPAGSR